MGVRLTRISSPIKSSTDASSSNTSHCRFRSPDSLCSSQFSAGLFYQMVAAMKLTNRAQAYENWNKDMPVLILAGQSDPVGNMGKGVVTLKKRMEQAGMKNVFLHILSNSRHNTLMEHASGDAEKAMALMRDLILS